MLAFIISFIYVTIICHLTVNEAAKITSIVHEAIYTKITDDSMQVDVNIDNFHNQSNQTAPLFSYLKN